MSIYNPEYTNSWALVIGINNYYHVPPLEYARNDAEEVARLLVKKFGFPEENVIVLLDDDASKKSILSSFLGFTKDTIGVDDRILVYYAGHGHTISGRRGEVGYLIPVDGTLDDLSSFIRWEDLTLNSELIQAKHMLFIMDACYGGLAITRALQPRSTRFLRDMLQRYSRQVLTAGKADEAVSDSDGPIPGHSIFTGHLLEALQGKAASEEGVITANDIMSYVYKKVSTDLYSKQTPHYGFIDGDGEFIFSAPILNHRGKNDVDVQIEYNFFERAKYRQAKYNDITIRYIESMKPQENNLALIESEIQEWLIENGFDINNQILIKDIITSIIYNVTGLGLLGYLLEEKEISHLDVLRGRMGIVDANDTRHYYEFSSTDIDFDRCLNYLSKHIHLDNEYMGFGSVDNEMEILILKPPVCSEANIHIQKREQGITLHEANAAYFIPKECNQLLNSLIKERKNILVLGGVDTKPFRIVSAISSIFEKGENIVLIEDRREVTVMSGNFIPIICSSSDMEILIQKLNQGLMLKGDRTIFNIGNYSHESFLLTILRSIDSCDGNIISLVRDAKFLKDINNDFPLIVLDSEFDTKLIQKIDVVIKLKYHYKVKGYISEILVRDQAAWNRVFKFKVNENS